MQAQPFQHRHLRREQDAVHGVAADALALGAHQDAALAQQVRRLFAQGAIPLEEDALGKDALHVRRRKFPFPLEHEAAADAAGQIELVRRLAAGDEVGGRVDMRAVVRAQRQVCEHIAVRFRRADAAEGGRRIAGVYGGRKQFLRDVDQRAHLPNFAAK